MHEEEDHGFGSALGHENVGNFGVLGFNAPMVRWIASTTPRDMPVVMMDSRDSARGFLPLYLNQSLQSKGVGGFEVFVLMADALDKRSLQGRALSLTVIPPPPNDNANKNAPLYIMGNVHVLSTSGRVRSQPWHGAHVSPCVRPHGASQNHGFRLFQ